MSDTIEAWYFSPADKRLPNGDGREIAIGVTHCVQPPLELCYHGLHASVKAIDALGYATSPIVWRVKLSGEIESGKDKLCATHREYVSGGIDISDTLFEFARMCALSVAHLWDMPDIVRQYLETGDESLKSAAWAAAWDAARDAARDAQNVQLEAMLLEAIAKGEKR